MSSVVEVLGYENHSRRLLDIKESKPPRLFSPTYPPHPPEKIKVQESKL